MMRYKKIVLKAPEGYTFVVSQEDSGELSITLSSNKYFGNYTQPPIPEGWKHVMGRWSNGFVIQDFRGNQFVWVPVGFLDANGTLDGIMFTEKFGRRNYLCDDFTEEYDEKMDFDLRCQLDSVRKYGGFYISRYAISKNNENYAAQSVPFKMPWTNISWIKAMRAAMSFGDGVNVTSHLTFGAEYDSTLEWFIKSGARTRKEVMYDSTDWGNFCNTKNSPKKVVMTGTREEWTINHICDFAGNIHEWTQEQKGSTCYRVIRGGSYNCNGDCYPVAFRDYDNHNYGNYLTGFRAVLYLA